MILGYQNWQDYILNRWVYFSRIWLTSLHSEICVATRGYFCYTVTPIFTLPVAHQELQNVNVLTRFEFSSIDSIRVFEYRLDPYLLCIAITLDVRRNYINCNSTHRYISGHFCNFIWSCLGKPSFINCNSANKTCIQLALLQSSEGAQIQWGMHQVHTAPIF